MIRGDVETFIVCRLNSFQNRRGVSPNGRIPRLDVRDLYRYVCLSTYADCFINCTEQPFFFVSHMGHIEATVSGGDASEMYTS